MDRLFMALAPTPTLKVRQIEIRTHVHATESLDRVLSFLGHLIQQDITDLKESELQVEHVSGSFGNPIHVVSIFLRSKKRIDPLLANLATRLNDQDKNILHHRFFPSHEEKLRYIFRVDKQYLSTNQVQLATTPDKVQINVSLINQTPQFKTDEIQVEEYLHDLGLI